MSSRSRKARAKYELPPQTDVDTLEIDAYVPDYGRYCDVCGRTPCVTGTRDGKVVLDSALCGACTWGADAYLDPDNWWIDRGRKR